MDQADNGDIADCIDAHSDTSMKQSIEAFEDDIIALGRVEVSRLAETPDRMLNSIFNSNRISLAAKENLLSQRPGSVQEANCRLKSQCSDDHGLGAGCTQTSVGSQETG